MTLNGIRVTIKVFDPKMTSGVKMVNYNKTIKLMLRALT